MEVAYLAGGNGFQESAGEGDKGLVGGVVPLDGGVDLGLEFLAVKEGVEDADAIKIKPIRVGGEVLEKVG